MYFISFIIIDLYDEIQKSEGLENESSYSSSNNDSSYFTSQKSSNHCEQCHKKIRSKNSKRKIDIIEEVEENILIESDVETEEPSKSWYYSNILKIAVHLEASSNMGLTYY